MNINSALTPRNILLCIVCIAICQSAGLVGSIFTFDAIPNWYANLNRPEIAPPNWVFGPVWTTLYTLMGISLFLVVRNGFKDSKVRLAVYIFAIQLILNSLWSIIFFGEKNLMGAFYLILVLLGTILLTIILFYRIRKLAAILLIPYVLWVSFASVLNYSFARLNEQSFSISKNIVNNHNPVKNSTCDSEINPSKGCLIEKMEKSVYIDISKMKNTKTVFSESDFSNQLSYPFLLPSSLQSAMKKKVQIRCTPIFQEYQASSYYHQENRKFAYYVFSPNQDVNNKIAFDDIPLAKEVNEITAKRIQDYKLSDNDGNGINFITEFQKCISNQFEMLIYKDMYSDVHYKSTYIKFNEFGKPPKELEIMGYAEPLFTTDSEDNTLYIVSGNGLLSRTIIKIELSNDESELEILQYCVDPWDTLEDNYYYCADNRRITQSEESLIVEKGTIPKGVQRYQYTN